MPRRIDIPDNEWLDIIHRARTDTSSLSNDQKQTWIQETHTLLTTLSGHPSIATNPQLVERNQ